MNKVLVNVSNHPSMNWMDEQKKEWDEIIDIPFPAVNPELTTGQVMDLLVPIMEELGQIRSEKEKKLFINFQGEYTLTYLFARLFFEVLKNDGWHLVVPTTQRVAIEKDGTKTSVFQFVRWREI